MCVVRKMRPGVPEKRLWYDRLFQARFQQDGIDLSESPDGRKSMRELRGLRCRVSNRSIFPEIRRYKKFALEAGRKQEIFVRNTGIIQRAERTSFHARISPMMVMSSVGR